MAIYMALVIPQLKRWNQQLSNDILDEMEGYVCPFFWVLQRSPLDRYHFILYYTILNYTSWVENYEDIWIERLKSKGEIETKSIDILPQ